VTVALAETEGVASRPVDASNPEGTSSAMIGVPDPFAHVMRSATRPIGAPDSE
jgi:hypothetical protein